MKDKRQIPKELLTKRQKDLIARFRNRGQSDVDGSYTGTAKDGSPPVQDSDDL